MWSLNVPSSPQNNVRVHGLKEYVVTSIEEVIRVIYFGNSEGGLHLSQLPANPLPPPPPSLLSLPPSSLLLPLCSLSPPFPQVNRTTGETNMNERSSRSHAVLSIAVESRVKDGDGTVKVSSLVRL